MIQPRFLACTPPADTPVPEPVKQAAGDDLVIPVWINGLGGMTFKLIGSQSTRFAKFSPASRDAEGQLNQLMLQELDLRHEVDRLRFAEQYTPVPSVLSFEMFDIGQLLVTEAMNGVSVISDLGKQNPAKAATALGMGLRQFHTRIPVEQCPYEWNIESRTAVLEPKEREQFLSSAPPEDLVVCHADACAPNTLMDSNCQFIGHVDLGMMGIGDRWADLSIAALSTLWNFGPGFEHLVYEGYEIDPDTEKIEYYRRLWDAT